MEELTCFLFTNLQLLAWSNIATFSTVASIQLTHILVNCRVRPPVQYPPRCKLKPGQLQWWPTSDIHALRVTHDEAKPYNVCLFVRPEEASSSNAAGQALRIGGNIFNKLSNLKNKLSKTNG